MLRHDGEPKQWAFADQARAVRAVPADHVLMRMRRTVDWAAAERELAGEYDPSMGRPSWPPAVLLRMLVLEQFADLSDREVHEQVGYNLLYRAFVGLGVEDAVPDDTTLVRFRARVGEAGIRAVFATLNQQWEAAGLMGDTRRVLDGGPSVGEGGAPLLGGPDAQRPGGDRGGGGAGRSGAGGGAPGGVRSSGGGAGAAR